MELLAIITMLALVQVSVFGTLVGLARGRYAVKAPAVSGNELFERYYRVHYNTIEQLVLFLPSLWTFGYFVGQYWAAALGVVYLVGRTIYAISYVRNPAGRRFGMLVSMLPCWVLVLGSLIAATLSFLGG